jgi:hypothetical protein
LNEVSRVRRPTDCGAIQEERAGCPRFRRKPKTRVEFEGGTRVRSEERTEDVELETDSRTERRNLPEEVQPGVTYRDVEVGWAAEARAEMPDEGDDDSDDD